MFNILDRVVVVEVGLDCDEEMLGIEGTVVDISDGNWITISWDIESWNRGDERYSEALDQFYENCWSVPSHCISSTFDPCLRQTRIERKIKQMWERQIFVKTLKKLEENKVEKSKIEKKKVSNLLNVLLNSI
jgi:hypothetical protein